MGLWAKDVRKVADLINGASPLGARSTLTINGWSVYQSGVESNDWVTTWVRSPGDTIQTKMSQGTVEVVGVTRAKL